MSSDDVASEIQDGKNARSMKCKYCDSIILKPETANFVKTDFELPTVAQQKNCPNTATELINNFWLVEDMFTFHNIGFSHSVGNTKYLACADCDAGPVGYHDLESKKNYVAFNRVEYVP